MMSRFKGAVIGRDRATPTTPFEIDGATQVWHLSAHYAQFRAPAFPSPVPCRSRCRALAGLARARTSDDIRLRALCTPPPKSFAPTPGPFVSVQYCHGHQGVVSIVSRPGCTSAPIVTFARQHTCALCGSALYSSPQSPAEFRVISKGTIDVASEKAAASAALADARPLSVISRLRDGRGTPRLTG